MAADNTVTPRIGNLADDPELDSERVSQAALPNTGGFS